MILDALSVFGKSQEAGRAPFLDAVAPVFHLQPKAQPLRSSSC